MELLESASCRYKDGDTYAKMQIFSLANANMQELPPPEVMHMRQCFMDALRSGGVSADYTGRLQYIMQKDPPVIGNFRVRREGDLYHEAAIGICVCNRMRSVPNFMFTYAYFQCNVPPAVKEWDDFPYRRAYMPPFTEMFARLQDIARDPPREWSEAGEGRLGIVERTFPEEYEQTDSLSDHFSEKERISCHEEGKQSPAEVWMALRQRDDLPRGARDRREAVYKEARGCNLFNAALATYLLKHYNARNILDCAAGWGDRLIAAYAAGAIAYRGWDTNALLQDSYDNIGVALREYFHKSTLDWDIVPAPFESASPRFGPGGDLQHKFDIVFFSPPFYRKELYRGSVTSTTLHVTEDKWYENFYKPAIRAAAGALVPGGRILAYVTRDMKDIANNVLRALGVTYEGAIGFRQMTDGQRPWIRDIFVWRRGTGTGNVPALPPSTRIGGGHCSYTDGRAKVNYLVVEDVGDTKTLVEGVTTHDECIRFLLQMYNALSLADRMVDARLTYINPTSVRVKVMTKGIMSPIYGISGSLLGYLDARKVPIFSDYSTCTAEVTTSTGKVHLDKGTAGDWKKETLHILSSLGNIAPAGAAEALASHGTVHDFFSWLLQRFSFRERSLGVGERRYKEGLERAFTRVDATVEGAVYADVKLEILLQVGGGRDAISRVIEHELSGSSPVTPDIFISARRVESTVYDLSNTILSFMEKGLPLQGLRVGQFRDIVENFVIAYGRVRRFVDVAKTFASSQQGSATERFNLWYSRALPSRPILDEFSVRVKEDADREFPHDMIKVHEIMGYLIRALAV